jgi:hypothetical protein
MDASIGISSLRLVFGDSADPSAPGISQKYRLVTKKTVGVPWYFFGCAFMFSRGGSLEAMKKNCGVRTGNARPNPISPITGDPKDLKPEPV